MWTVNHPANSHLPLCSPLNKPRNSFWASAPATIGTNLIKFDPSSSFSLTVVLLSELWLCRPQPLWISLNQVVSWGDTIPRLLSVLRRSRVPGVRTVRTKSEKVMLASCSDPLRLPACQHMSASSVTWLKAYPTKTERSREMFVEYTCRSSSATQIFQNEGVSDMSSYAIFCHHDSSCAKLSITMQVFIFVIYCCFSYFSLRGLLETSVFAPKFDEVHSRLQDQRCDSEHLLSTCKYVLSIDVTLHLQYLQ